MKIYITRHGKTEWNVEGRFQGAKDSPLVKSGIDDALSLNQYIKGEKFDAIYTSPLGRAKQTSQLVFPNQTIIDDKRLEEMNFGIFEGMKTEEIFESYGELYDNLWNHPEQFTRCPNGGESYADVKKRIISFLEEVKSQNYEKIFIVTHGMYFVCLLGYILGYEPKDFVKINRYIVRGCSLTVIEENNGHYEIIKLGDDHYLKKEAKTSFLIQQKKDVA